MAESVACVVLTTVPEEQQGKGIARILVEEKLAACVSLLPIARSIYFWEGKVEEEPEFLLLIKTSPARVPALKDRLFALHPYKVPEFLVLPVQEGGEGYLAWMAEVLARS